MNIIAYNPDVDQLERTFLSYRTQVGATLLKVKNADKYAVDDKILVGAMSRERSEILTVVGTTATTITTTPAIFPHDADDPVYSLDYDQVRFFRSDTGEGGAYEELATVDIDVDNVDGTTRYDDLNSLESYYYKIAYYNSVDDVESEPTPPLKATGYDPKSAGYIIQSAARSVGDPDFMDWPIENWLDSMNDINDDLITQSKIPYKFLRTDIPLDIEEGSTEVEFPENLWKIDYVQPNTPDYGGERFGSVKVYSEADFTRKSTSFRQLPGDGVDYVAFANDGRSMFFAPAARTQRINAFVLYYYKFFDRIENMSSKIETPNALVYKWGMMRDYYMWKTDQDSKFMAKATTYDQRYGGEIAKLQREKSIVARGPSGFGPQIRRYRR